GPFLDLLHTFRRELADADLVTAIGYSFGDVHINEYLSQWLNNDPKHKLRIVNPNFSGVQNEYAQTLRMHAKDRLQIFSETAGSALLSLYGEQHNITNGTIQTGNPGC